MAYQIDKSDAQWKQELDPQRYHVLREAGTERPFTGALLDEHRDGVFSCGACGAELFRSDTKFESGSGWPSFWQPITPGAVELRQDRAFGMVRTEALCANCGSHLGHVFDDAYGTPTGDRYCMNSLSLDFAEKGAATGASDTAS
jgi:peptide-methionine (R)-S-oxide reductase